MKFKIKKFVKSLIPPIIMSLYKSRLSRYGLFNNFNSWKEAKQQAVGYESDIILAKVKEALLKVKNGEAIYERDSVLFDKIDYSWPLVCGLLSACVDNAGLLRVLDFGGSLGTTYFQNKLFLQGVRDLQWAIVEQENFIKTGKEFFEDEVLKFYYDLDTCAQETKPNVMLLSGVIQYIQEPYKILDQLMKLNVNYLLIDRTPLIKEKSRIVIQKVNPVIYDASYPCWLLNDQELLSYLKRDYNVLSDFDANDGQWWSDGVLVSHKGYILKRKK